MEHFSPDLNQRAGALCNHIASRCTELGVLMHQLPCGTRLFDFSAGGIQAGEFLARVCLADLAAVKILEQSPWPQLQVSTQHPVAACMASQYAGWEIKGQKYFAMGSGPMRAAAGRESLYDDIGYRETSDQCIGVLETSDQPPEEVCQDIATKCGINPSQLTLLFAPANSTPGNMQVVARSVETSLHKLHELGFDLLRVAHGIGRAPIPPVANDTLAAIGRTNDAILYGGQVTLTVYGDDQSLQDLGPQLPSSASTEYGRPFAEILNSYNNDFYQVDPLLFSAAKITLQNLDTGNEFCFGKLNDEILAQSFSS